MPRHANKTSYQAGEKHIHWKGGNSNYWHKKAREIKNHPKGKVVHHINGDVKDNRIENLKVMPQAKHVAIHNKQRTGMIKPKSKIRQVIKDVLKLKNSGYSRKEIVAILNVNYRMVKRCLTTKWRCQYDVER